MGQVNSCMAELLRARSVARLSVVLFLLALLGGCTAGDNGRERVALNDGGVLDLSQLQGRVLVVNYWAIWCAPCRHEIPELNRLAKEDSDKVLVVGVNYDKVSGEQLAQQLEELAIEFATLLRDPAAELGHTATGVLPETLIVAPDGRLQQVLVGPQTLASLRAAVAQVQR